MHNIGMIKMLRGQVIVNYFMLFAIYGQTMPRDLYKKLKALFLKITTALAKITTALAKITTALAKIKTALAKFKTAVVKKATAVKKKMRQKRGHCNIFLYFFL